MLTITEAEVESPDLIIRKNVDQQLRLALEKKISALLKQQTSQKKISTDDFYRFNPKHALALSKCFSLQSATDVDFLYMASVFLGLNTRHTLTQHDTATVAWVNDTFRNIQLPNTNASLRKKISDDLDKKRELIIEFIKDIIYLGGLDNVQIGDSQYDFLISLSSATSQKEQTAIYSEKSLQQKAQQLKDRINSSNDPFEIIKKYLVPILANLKKSQETKEGYPMIQPQIIKECIKRIIVLFKEMLADASLETKLVTIYKACLFLRKLEDTGKSWAQEHQEQLRSMLDYFTAVFKSDEIRHTTLINSGNIIKLMPLFQLINDELKSEFTVPYQLAQLSEKDFIETIRFEIINLDLLACENKYAFIANFINELRSNRTIQPERWSVSITDVTRIDNAFDNYRHNFMKRFIPAVIQKLKNDIDRSLTIDTRIDEEKKNSSERTKFQKSATIIYKSMYQFRSINVYRYSQQLMKGVLVEYSRRIEELIEKNNSLPNLVDTLYNYDRLLAEPPELCNGLKLVIKDKIESLIDKDLENFIVPMSVYAAFVEFARKLKVAKLDLFSRSFSDCMQDNLNFNEPFKTAYDIFVEQIKSRIEKEIANQDPKNQIEILKSSRLLAYINTPGNVTPDIDGNFCNSVYKLFIDKMLSANKKQLEIDKDLDEKEGGRDIKCYRRIMRESKDFPIELIDEQANNHLKYEWRLNYFKELINGFSHSQEVFELSWMILVEFNHNQQPNIHLTESDSIIIQQAMQSFLDQDNQGDKDVVLGFILLCLKTEVWNINTIKNYLMQSLTHLYSQKLSNDILNARTTKTDMRAKFSPESLRIIESNLWSFETQHQEIAEQIADQINNEFLNLDITEKISLIPLLEKSEQFANYEFESAIYQSLLTKIKKDILSYMEGILNNSHPENNYIISRRSMREVSQSIPPILNALYLCSSLDQEWKERCVQIVIDKNSSNLEEYYKNHLDPKQGPEHNRWQVRRIKIILNNYIFFNSSVFLDSEELYADPYNVRVQDECKKDFCKILADDKSKFLTIVLYIFASQNPPYPADDLKKIYSYLLEYRSMRALNEMNFWSKQKCERRTTNAYLEYIDQFTNPDIFDPYLDPDESKPEIVALAKKNFSDSHHSNQEIARHHAMQNFKKTMVRSLQGFINSYTYTRGYTYGRESLLEILGSTREFDQTFIEVIKEEFPQTHCLTMTLFAIEICVNLKLNDADQKIQSSIIELLWQHLSDEKIQKTIIHSLSKETKKHELPTIVYFFEDFFSYSRKALIMNNQRDFLLKIAEMIGKNVSAMFSSLSPDQKINLLIAITTGSLRSHRVAPHIQPEEESEQAHKLLLDRLLSISFEEKEKSINHPDPMSLIENLLSSHYNGTSRIVLESLLEPNSITEYPIKEEILDFFKQAGIQGQTKNLAQVKNYAEQVFRITEYWPLVWKKESELIEKTHDHPLGWKDRIRLIKLKMGHDPSMLMLTFIENGARSYLPIAEAGSRGRALRDVYLHLLSPIRHAIDEAVKTSVNLEELQQKILEMRMFWESNNPVLISTLNNSLYSLQNRVEHSPRHYRQKFYRDKKGSRIKIKNTKIDEINSMMNKMFKPVII